MNKIRLICGFMAAKLGMGCGSRNSRAFIRGWFLGAGIKVYSFFKATKRYGKKGWRLSTYVHTRKVYKYGYHRAEDSVTNTIGYALSFGYGAVMLDRFNN